MMPDGPLALHTPCVLAFLLALSWRRQAPNAEDASPLPHPPKKLLKGKSQAGGPVRGRRRTFRDCQVNALLAREQDEVVDSEQGCSYLFLKQNLVPKSRMKMNPSSQGL